MAQAKMIVYAYSPQRRLGNRNKLLASNLLASHYSTLLFPNRCSHAIQKRERRYTQIFCFGGREVGVKSRHFLTQKGALKIGDSVLWPVLSISVSSSATGLVQFSQRQQSFTSIVRCHVHASDESQPWFHKARSRRYRDTAGASAKWLIRLRETTDRVCGRGGAWRAVAGPT